MNLVEQVEQELGSARKLEFAPGDEIRVHVKIKEGDKTRIQIFEGTVISIKGTGSRTMFIVRKMSFDVGVERIFPLYSPTIDKIDLKVRHSVRRARIYYLRGRAGKAARLKELVTR
jgi:large subunit ribosomal protein L19